MRERTPQERRKERALSVGMREQSSVQVGRVEERGSLEARVAREEESGAGALIFLCGILCVCMGVCLAVCGWVGATVPEEEEEEEAGEKKRPFFKGRG